MNSIQYLLLIIIVFVLWRVWARKRAQEIDNRVWLGWTIFWLLAGVATFLPQTADLIASRLGLTSGRGVDLIVYISIPLLFYVLFRLLVKVDRLEQNLTKIIRHLAIKEKTEKKD